MVKIVYLFSLIVACALSQVNAAVYKRDRTSTTSATLIKTDTDTPCTTATYTTQTHVHTLTETKTHVPTLTETPESPYPECYLFQRAGYSDVFELLIPSTEPVVAGGTVDIIYKHPAGGLITRILADTAPNLLTNSLSNVADLDSDGLPIDFVVNSELDTDGLLQFTVPEYVTSGEYLVRVYMNAYEGPCSITTGPLTVVGVTPPVCTLGALVCTNDLTAVQQCIVSDEGNVLEVIDQCSVQCRQTDELSATCSGPADE